MHHERLAGLQSPALEHVGEDGEGGLRQGGRLDQAQPFGNGQGVPGVHPAIFGVASAAQKRANRIADFPARCAFTDGGYFARHFQP